MLSQVQQINSFIGFAVKELKIKKPKVNLVGASENQHKTFGHFDGSEITVRMTERHPIDVMRTIAHELVHVKQYASGTRNFGQKEEDEANAIAGRIMRKFDGKYPHVFTLKPVPANIAEEMISATPTNAIGAGDAIAKYDKFLRRKPLTRKPTDVFDTRGTGPTSVNGPMSNVFNNGNNVNAKTPLDRMKEIIDLQKPTRPKATLKNVAMVSPHKGHRGATSKSR